MALAGGAAGAVARTATAPLDRVKLLFQVQAVASSGTTATAYTGVGQAFAKIFRDEGLLSFWKGNVPQLLRIFPYSATQLTANDQYKRLLAGWAAGSGSGGRADPDQESQLTVPLRLAAGAMAGMTATALTHPLDVMRLRLALPRSPYTEPAGLGNALVTVVRSEGVPALYKGLAPTLVGIAPYAAINFASYDLLKRRYYGDGSDRRKQTAVANMVMGGAAGTLASSLCYPLDTIRRRMQMVGRVYDGQLDAFATIWREEGIRGFYRGWAVNALKVVPSNAIRFVAYEGFKSLFGVQKATTDT